MADVSGWLLLDKPAGPSSAQALARAKRLYGARRAGHAGTLDPLAEGLLPLAFGSATRWCGYLLGADKTYRFTLRLGIESETQDAEGLPEDLPEAIVEIPRDEIGTLLARFTGTLMQTPPMYSAVRHQGERLYRRARRGETVERAPRQVEVQELRLLAVRPGEWDLEVRCSKGTYVRTLGHDLGRALGCGACVTALRRVRIGELEVTGAVDLETLQEESGTQRLARLLSPDAVLSVERELSCDAHQAQALRQGRAVPCGESGLIRLVDDHGRFFGVGRADDGWLRPQRLMPLPGSGTVE